MNNKIGIGITTCNRPYFLQKLVSSLSPCNDVAELVVINDGGEFRSTPQSVTKWIDNETNIGVGKSKNKALRYLLQKECDYIFLIEDDMVVTDKQVFSKYIEASKLSGIQHLNFAFHGSDNYRPDGSPAIKLSIQYSKDCAVSLFPNVYGAFSFYTKKCLEEVGLMDEQYINAMEHVDHTFLIHKAGMHPHFRWFADLHNSNLYLSEQDANHSASTIRRDENWMSNFRAGVERFRQKSGIDVCSGTEIVASKEEVLQLVKAIKKNYAQR